MADDDAAMATAEAMGARGFAGPIDVLSAPAAASCLAELDAYAARLEGGVVQGTWRFQTHLFLPWVADIVRSEALLRHVRAALGGSEDVLVWFTEWHLKEPGSEGRYTPHQVRGVGPPSLGRCPNRYMMTRSSSHAPTHNPTITYLHYSNKPRTPPTRAWSLPTRC